MEKELYPVIEKYIGKKDVSKFGAFATGENIKFILTVPRRMGVNAPIFRIKEDGGQDSDYDTLFVSTDGMNDKYEIEYKTTEKDGLYYYTFVFPNGYGAFFCEPYNNVDFKISDTDNCRFSLLVYEKEFTTPKWLGRGVMYHLFTDRFFKGNGEVDYRNDSVLDPDWDNGVPQYAKRSGDPVSNNVFFGGNLWGVAEKLPYLKSLGVSVIYLSPIFSAYSNHKYDTSDYMTVDGGFGGEAAFDNLLSRAKKEGIRIILDGVFNHTGDDSIYFDVKHRYNGAVSNPDSPYRDWYNWKQYPDEYECWWGIRILPRLNHGNDSCRSYFTGKDGVIEKYIKKGISGWRLDVADELSDRVLDEIRTAAKNTDKEAVIIGEVWENAAEKTAYGQRRRYLRGKQLDSVMNYPFRNAAIAFAKYGDAEQLYDVLTAIYGSYPRCVSDRLMNIIGTHDTERILTVLGGEEDQGYDNGVLANKRLTPREKEAAIPLLKIAATLQFTVYGIPSLYYGDEAGVEGYHDPFCRMPYPWGREDSEILEYYRFLGQLRSKYKAFDSGDFTIVAHGSDYIVYDRENRKDKIRMILNRGEAMNVSLDGVYRNALTDEVYMNSIKVLQNSATVLIREGEV